jgi:hypothetical protein
MMPGERVKNEEAICHRGIWSLKRPDRSCANAIELMKQWVSGLHAVGTEKHNGSHIPQGWLEIIKHTRDYDVDLYELLSQAV